MKLLLGVLLFGVAATVALLNDPAHGLDWSAKAVDMVAVVGSKLFFKAASNENVPFGDYVQFCHTHEMQTATIETSAEQAAIQAYMDDHNITSGFWLGGWKINHEGNWTWINGDREMLYTHWMNADPPASHNHSCIWYRGNTGYWQDSRCTDTWVPFCHLKVFGSEN